MGQQLRAVSGPLTQLSVSRAGQSRTLPALTGSSASLPQKPGSAWPVKEQCNMWALPSTTTPAADRRLPAQPSGYEQLTHMSLNGRQTAECAQNRADALQRRYILWGLPWLSGPPVSRAIHAVRV